MEKEISKVHIIFLLPLQLWFNEILLLNTHFGSWNCGSSPSSEIKILRVIKRMNQPNLHSCT